MPTEGLTERRMPRTARTGTDSSAKRPEPKPSHRSSDALGVALLGAAAIVLIALWVGNGGLLGDSLASFFRSLFGRGAWAVPAVIAFAGGSLLAGRSFVQVWRVAWGATLGFMGIVGALAGTHSGDFFDPQIIPESGGYIGAIVGWSMDSLLGAGKMIGITTLCLLGIVLCADAPLRSLASAWTKRNRRLALDEDEPKPGAIRRSAEDLKAAAVKMLEKDETDAPSERPSRSLKTRELEGSVKLDTATGMPAEGYVLPPLSLLQEPVSRPKRSQQEMQRNIETLETTLEQFGIEANVVEVATGPTITRYEIQLGPGIRVSRISALADNLAMNLAAAHVRIEAPIPGKSAIGVEVPTAVRSMVTLREMCESLEFHDNQSRLAVALGKDVSGVQKYTDLSKMPHLLIGGATNSGKSICLASLIMSLVLRNTPKDLRLVMIDPKRVELALFEGLPHLMCPVVKDVKEAPGVLRAVWREMDRRYDKFSEAGVRNIDGWNERASFQDRLPYIVVVIDQLADLMIQAAAEVETSICRIAQLARATGIHLVIATQRPSVDVITGTIKANIASRIAFAVSSQIDSRTILDQAGAEKLIGKGDMLFLPIDATKPVRIQGCYVAEKEIADVCHFWRQQEKPHYVLNPVQIAIEDKEAQIRDEESDPLWEESVRWVVDRGQASTSMLQRKFSIGFQRASRLLDMMEERGIVGPRDGPRPREVLLDPMQAEALFRRTQFLDPVPDEEMADGWDDD